jgi:GAF domain-containing protein
MTQTTSPNTTFWNRLLDPHSSIQNATARRRARVLAGVSLVLLLTVGALVLWNYFVNPGGSATSLIAIIVVAGAYALSRTRWASWGAQLLVVGLTVLILYFMFTSPSGVELVIATPFLIVPVLLATLLLDARFASVIAGAAVLSVILALLIVPDVTFGQYVGPFGVVIIISALSAVTSFLRERDIATIEKQARELSQYGQSLQDEARNIMITAQVGQAITATRDLDQLLKQIVNLIVERFPEVYHAQVFLIDEEEKVAVLRESTGEAGKQLLARAHKLPVGSQSVIGRVTDKGQPVVVSDTDLDPTHRRNELLPNTRSEMALPLIAASRVIGALDIQSTTPSVFRESEVRVFQTMADQLAVAIENARLFQRAQRDFEEIELLNRRLTGEGWTSFQRNRGALASGYEATASGVRPLPSGLEDGESGADDTIRMPLMVRGESVGMLDVKSRTGEPPSEEVQAILQAVAERVAQALDSTRLSETALRQAEREQVLGRISAELQATTDLDMILRVAAREASRALGTPRGFIHLMMEYGGEQPEAAEQG